VTLRGTDWLVVLGGTAVGVAILTICVLVGDDAPPLPYVRLALVPLATSAAFVLDEPAAAAVDAVPRGRLQRAAARGVVLLVPLTVWVSAVLALDLRNAGTPAVGLVVEGLGVLVAATAGAAVLRRLGRTEPGEVVATAVAAAVLAALVFAPRVRGVPVFPVGDRWVASSIAWLALALGALVLAGVASREPHRLRRAAERTDPLTERSRSWR
jgi:hypothetical protein